eukprot:269759_1
MEDRKEMEEITQAVQKLGIEATPNRRRSQRVRHLKAQQIVKNKQNTNYEAKTQPKPKIETKPKASKPTQPKTTKLNLDINIDQSVNDLVFPLFTTVQYKPITDTFDIHIPSHAHEWLHALLTMINRADIDKEVDAYSWMVLLYPSLLLMQQSKHTPHKLNKLVTKTLRTLSRFMCHEAVDQAHDLSLNDALICVELLANDMDQIPKSIWTHINTLMESTNTLNKFLKLSCARAKDIKAVQELLHCSSTQILDKKALYPKIRSKWESFIGVYTQMVRLHRLYVLDTPQLSAKCKQNILRMCTIFDTDYCKVLRDLYCALKQKSDDLKMDYAYYRYKTMAMATHTPTTIAPTFAGFYGCVEDGQKLDMSLWKVMVDALQSDTQLFVDTVQRILEKPKKKNVNLLSVIDKMNKKDTHALRVLDHICYNSVCAMLMYESCKDGAMKRYHAKLVGIRKDICDAVDTLAANGLLFCEEMNGLHKDMLHPCFLTYDR